MNRKLSLLLAVLSAAHLSAQVTLPAVLSSHMVIERDLPVHVWGKAAPGESITVSFRGETRSASASNLGRWSLYLSPGSAGGPFQMTVTGAASGGASPIVLDDVLVGDVWVASGQSNMEFMMHQAATADQDLPHAANPRLRLLVVKKKTSEYPVDDVDTEGWAASTPESARNFSAVAWYFARDLEQREHVPVGVIDSTWGGTPAEAWTRMEALGADASLAPLFSSWGKMTQPEEDNVIHEREEQRQRDEAKAQGKPAPQFPWHPNLLSWGPGMLWNGMIAPLSPFPIRGVIWYQGESNASLERSPLYGRIFRTLIEDWRHEWGVGDFPFLFVQIANFKTGSDSAWPALREQQVQTLALRNTGMAVTIDIGDPGDIHPTNKLDVGLRLARAARALSYGEQVEYDGPTFRQAIPEGAAMRVWLDHAKGLMAKGGELTGFEVAGTDGKFYPATAKIEGTTIVVTSSSVADPAYVRYGWADSPQCNLFNGEGLPASPFRSDPKF